MKDYKIKGHYHTLIVGGGIVGTAVLRELSHHGLDTLLIDKYDFCSQTSASSSKMLHGGIRYLENLDFSLVKEALHEKNLWLQLTPHLVQERSFYLPVYQDSLRPLWMIRAGLFLYDFLSNFKNSPHSSRDPIQARQEIAGLRAEGLKGAGVYFDSVVDDIKLGLELVYDALQNSNAEACSYLELEKVIEHNSKNVKVLLRDNLTGQQYETNCHELVVTTGPFTDQLFEQLDNVHWQKSILPSKGSHLWLKRDKFTFDQSVVLTPKDGRVIFVIPYPDKVLVGTTEVPVDKIEADLSITKKETQYLLSNLKEFFPELNIKQEDIISSFAGIRPLVMEDSSEGLGKVARNHKYYQPLSNIHVMIGGKYTTFRVMGQQVAQSILGKYNIPYNEKFSVTKLAQCSVFTPFDNKIEKEMVLASASGECVRTFKDLLIRRMGVFTRDHWSHQQDFDTFFLSLLTELQQYIKIEKSDITSF